MQAAVVVPTYNRPGRLRKVVESLVDQTSDEYHVILVDDGSDDPRQEDILAEVEFEHDIVTVLEQQNAGPAAARNRGWRHADADVILFTDDDCIVPENWIESLVGGFTDQDIAAVGGPFVPARKHFERSAFAKYHRFQSERNYRPIEQGRVQSEPLPHGITANIAYRRSVLTEVDGFDEGFPVAGGEDHDLIKRVAARGYSFRYVPTPVHHNDTYDVDGFLSRSFRRGKGLHYLHERHGPERGIGRVLLGLAASPVFALGAVLEYDGFTMAGIASLDRVVSRLGELAAIRNERF